MDHSTFSDREVEKKLEPDDSQGNTSMGTTDSSNIAGSLPTSHPNSGEASRCLEDFEQTTQSPLPGVLAPAEMETGKQNPVISSCKRPRETILIIDDDERDSNNSKLLKLSGRASRIEQEIVSPLSRVELSAPAERETGKQNPVFSSCKRQRETTPSTDGDERVSSSMKVSKLSGRFSHDSGTSSKKTHTGPREHLSKKLQFDSVELSIIELEELANKIKWLQGTVEHGMNRSKEMRPSWNFSSG